METVEKMYSLKEAAGPLGCSRDSVVRLIHARHLRAVEFPRMGGRGKSVKRQVPESEIKRFLERNRGTGPLPSYFTLISFGGVSKIACSFRSTASCRAPQKLA